MKTIGLLGGMSWESTLDYYKLINTQISKELGGFHSAKLSMISVEMEDKFAFVDVHLQCCQLKVTKSLIPNTANNKICVFRKKNGCAISTVFISLYLTWIYVHGSIDQQLTANKKYIGRLLTVSLPAQCI